MESRHMTEGDVEKEWRNRVEVLQWMMASSVRHVADVARVFSRYYRDPAGLLGGIRAAVPAAQLTAAERSPSTDPQDLATAPPAAAPAPESPAEPGASADVEFTEVDAPAGPATAARRRKGEPPAAVKRPKGRRPQDLERKGG
jgi:hypothetical protein